MPTEIRIVRIGEHDVGPVGGPKTNVPEGDTVTFTTDKDVGGHAEFKGPSPFRDQIVPWNKPLEVIVSFRPSDSEKNLYPYECTLVVNGQSFKSPVAGGWGGVLEIIKG